MQEEPQQQQDNSLYDKVSRTQLANHFLQIGSSTLAETILTEQVVIQLMTMFQSPINNMNQVEFSGSFKQLRSSLKDSLKTQKAFNDVKIRQVSELAAEKYPLDIQAQEKLVASDPAIKAYANFAQTDVVESSLNMQVIRDICDQFENKEILKFFLSNSLSPKDQIVAQFKLFLSILEHYQDLIIGSKIKATPANLTPQNLTKNLIHQMQNENKIGKLQAKADKEEDLGKKSQIQQLINIIKIQNEEQLKLNDTKRARSYQTSKVKQQIKQQSKLEKITKKIKQQELQQDALINNLNRDGDGFVIDEEFDDDLQAYLGRGMSLAQIKQRKAQRQNQPAPNQRLLQSTNQSRNLYKIDYSGLDNISMTKNNRRQITEEKPLKLNISLKDIDFMTDSNELIDTYNKLQAQVDESSYEDAAGQKEILDKLRDKILYGRT